MNNAASESAAPRRASHLRLLISIGVSAAIVFYIIRHLEWHAFVAELSRLHTIYALPLIAMLFLLAWVRALRWRVLLPQSATIEMATIFQATIAGFAATFILPLRAGEIVRPWLLSRWQRIPFTVTLASVVVERFFDALTLLVLLALCLLRYQNAPPIVMAGARMVAVTFVVLLAAVVLCYVRPAWVISMATAAAGRLFRRHPHIAAKITDGMTGIVAGFRGISSPGELLAALGLSAGLWLLMAAWYQVLLMAFGQSDSFWSGLLLNVMVTVAVAVPSAPGFVGTFQAGCLVALSVMQPHSREFATAYSLVAHALQLGVTVLVGLIIMQARGLSVRDIRRSAMPPRT